MKTHPTHFEPPLGAFIRPIGHYAYCLQVAEINQYDTGAQRAYKRWGLNDEGQPFDDGHCGGRSFLDLVPVIAGAWKEEAFNGYEAVYWKMIDVRPIKTDQLSLF